MKRCPECRRDYTDDTLSFCLEDGTPLVYGVSADEPATAILSAPISVTSGFAESDATANTAVLQPQATANGPVAVAGPGSLSGKRLVAIPILLAIFAIAGLFGYRYFASAGTQQINSIAVMPFVNDSGNPDIEYLSDGMTETLIASLTQLPNLNVKARSSVFRYKGKETDTQAVGKELNVQAI